MKRLLLSLALICAPAFAADTKPTDASIQELLTVTESASVIDGIWGQVDGMMKGMLAQNTQGKQLNAAQQAAIESFQAKYIALMREEISWAKLEPMYVRIYQGSLNQEEVDGMIAFYKTPAGQAVIKKLPVLVQQVMAEMPALMGPLMQKLQPLAMALDAEMKAAEAPSPEAAPAGAPAK